MVGASHRGTVVACLLVLLTTIGCSDNSFSSQSSKITASETPLETATPSPTPTPTPSPENPPAEEPPPIVPPGVPESQVLTYPTFFKVQGYPIQYLQTEFTIKTLDDGLSCILRGETQPQSQVGGLFLCLDSPELCWTTDVATVTRTTDFTCGRAYRAVEVFQGRGGSDCPVSVQALSDLELTQINDPNIYKMKTGSTDPNGLNLDPATTLPTLKSIKLSASCRCDYSSLDAPNFKYDLPALEEHCRAHFPEIYK